MGKWFGPQTGDCSCCEPDLICGCTGDTYPTNVSVTLSGWVDSGDCDGCDEFMGTYALNDTWFSLLCSWDNSVDAEASPCTSEVFTQSRIQVMFSDDGTNTVVTITVYYHAAGSAPYVENWVKYEKTFTGRIACDSLTDEPIPYDSHAQAAGKDDCIYGDPPATMIDDALLTTS